MSQAYADTNCAICAKRVPRIFLRCVMCKHAYHLETCCDVTENRYLSFYKLDKERRSQWKCFACVNTLPKVVNPAVSGPRNDISPLQAGSDKVSSPDDGAFVTHRSKPNDHCLNVSEEFVDSVEEDGDGCGDMPENTMKEMKQFWGEMRAFRVEMGSFRDTISDLTAIVKAQAARMDSLEKRIEFLEQRSSENVNCDIAKMEQTIMELRMELEERDQEMLSNDVEIVSLPEGSNESTTQLVLTVACKLGVELDERDIVSAQRVGAPRAPVAVGAAAARPRPLVVRVARRAQRDALLQAARVRRHLSSKDLVPEEQARTFYVNERLTRNNRQLFQKTRELASRLGWKYVWTREGKIFARQENGKTRHRVRGVNDFIKVFGANAIGSSVEV